MPALALHILPASALVRLDGPLLSSFITVPRSKHGEARRVPINSVVRSALLDRGAARQRPDDPAEHVFSPRPSQADVFFPKAVQRAVGALQGTRKDATRLEGYVWHSNRHTFASRLAMAVKDFGGWKTLSMVQRYAHLAPNHLTCGRRALGWPGAND